MTAFPIEESIPMPKLRKGDRYGDPECLKYPFAKMAVGDSIFVPEQTPEGGAVAASRRYGAVHGHRYTARTVPGKDGGVRIWRIK